ncbi:MAG: bifunctional (p)ppGpp synthetase/guanosine-3',5'-bis(diphosphate) 3'-pyrophosphohydrolase [Clostridia bacterium]|nr:bifunctional (p)ppGpp synthetase/guanosine-3',5'-bis(diphosphate) 3'-pyrophosphohydrolase [Clostridia bacterium]
MEQTVKKVEPSVSFDTLLSVIRKSGKEFDLEMIRRAYEFAEKAHSGQMRRSGEPYIVHPISVACIVVELGMDSESIAAALLHDVVEDTDTTLAQIQKEFGGSIAELIDGLTKISRIAYSDREEEQAENIRKMLIAMADDIRVIIIKLADRLHNMRTMQYQTPQKQRDKSLESMEVFAPIAHRLGIEAVKEELEDLSLRYLDPIAYAEIEAALAEKGENGLQFIEQIKGEIKERVSKTIPDVYIEGRVKSINGIYRKMFVQGRNFDEIFDVYAVRIIVDTVNDCYNVLGIIHDMLTPLPNRFKDYISTPKPNMYQSLHTTVIGRKGIPFEVQIRTWNMHYMAEYGIAAHWKYKLGLSKEDSFEKRLAWIRQMLEAQNDGEDSTDIVRNIKTDLAQEEVFVFTPHGDVINLPAGSTVIDFAYSIHSAIGNKMIGAKVDNRIVPIDYEVKTGDIVEIVTTKDPNHGPNRDWLNIVKTSSARNKIRLWFKKERREENIAQGREAFEKELTRNGISFTQEELAALLENVLKKHSCSDMDDFYSAIGYGGIQLWKVIPRLRDEYAKQKNTPTPEELAAQLSQNQLRTKTHAKGGVLIDGMDNCLIKFSRCCNPLPGDDIIGFVTRGFGVSIHKRECPNVPRDLSAAAEPERWVRAHWDTDAKETYQSTLEITAEDRDGLLMEITQQIFNMHLMMHALNSRVTKDGKAIVYVDIVVNGQDHLRSVIQKLSTVRGVLTVKRS